MEHNTAENNKFSIVPASQNAQISASGDEREIDLIELFFTLLHNWKLFVLFFLIGAALMGAYHTYFVTPTYRASTEIYITSSNSVISLQDLQIGNALNADYRAIITSRSVLNKVIENLDLNTDYKGLEKMITVTNPDSTHIIRTQVTTGDLSMSRDIANELLNVSIDRIYQIIGTGEPTIIDYSEAEAVENVTPGIVRYMAIGGIVGCLIIGAILVIKMLMDNTLKTDDDIEKSLQLPVLAAVPFYKE